MPSEELTKIQKKHLGLAYRLLDEILAIYAKERTPRKEPKFVIYKDLPNPGEYADNEIRCRQDVLYNEGKPYEF